jgi:hypothetical protein
VRNSITTDPVSMDGNDRLTGSLNVEYIFNSDPTGVEVQAQTSMDGNVYLDAGPPFAVVGPGPFGIPSIVAPAAFVRYIFSFGAAGGVGAVCFDVHVEIDHA